MIPDTSIGIVVTQTATFPEGISLENDLRIEPLEVAYETYGELSAEKDNAILVCHALSGDAHAAGYHEGARKPGWWEPYIGPGKAFDTNRYFVIATNVIGGCQGSSGPTSMNPNTGKPFGSEFPFVSIEDMVNAQHKLVKSFGIETLYCVAGGSMGGMQALQWSVAYPEMVPNCIIMASTAEHSAQQISFNEVGRQAILSDPNWNDGNYMENPNGLAIARMIGHITYLSDDSMREKFGRKPPRGNIKNADFAVGSYLLYQGESFLDRFDANSYIYVTKALDHYSLGKGRELTKALSDVKANYLIIAYSSDWLYPPYQSREIVKSLEVNSIPVTYCEMNASKGHDSFLIENSEQSHLIHHFLQYGTK
ncbi:MAG: homoserine O-acetyltransferase [Spirochaetota bacterium]